MDGGIEMASFFLAKCAYKARNLYISVLNFRIVDRISLSFRVEMEEGFPFHLSNEFQHVIPEILYVNLSSRYEP